MGNYTLRAIAIQLARYEITTNFRLAYAKDLVVSASSNLVPTVRHTTMQLSSSQGGNLIKNLTT